MGIYLLKMFYKVCALIATVAAANGPGISVSISKEGINNAKNVAVPYIFNIIKDIQVPEVDFDGGFLKNIAIALPQPPITDITLNTDSANNGAELLADGVTAHLTADFSYTYFLTVSGSADVKVNKMSIDMEIDVSEQPGTPSTEMAPKLKVQKSAININPDDLDITLSGSLVAKIASVFIPLFKSTIVPLVVKQVQAQIVTVVDTTINQDLVVYGNQETIPYLAGVTGDYAQYGTGAQFTEDNIFEMSVLGYFFNKNSATPSKYTPVAMPTRLADGQAAQGSLSEYTLNTLMEAAYSTQNTLDITYLLSKLNVTVTTDNLGVVVPEILAKYGSGKAVGISGKFITKQSEFTMTPKDNTLDANLAVTITVAGEQAIYAEFNNIQAIGQVSSKAGAIFGALSTSNIGTVVESSFKSVFTGMTGASLQTELQKVTTTNVAILNALLAKGIVIPSLFGIQITGLDLTCHQGYVAGGINVTPATWEGIADLMIAAADELRYIRRLNRIAEINADYYAARQ